MKKKWLNRMLISYVPVLFIVITILVVLFLLTVTELSKREAIKTNELLLENIMNTLDTKLQAVDQLIIQEILFEDTLDKLFRTGNLPQNRFLTEYEFSKKLKDIANKISHIDYLYVYRASDQAVFSNTAKFPLEQFGDRRFINEYLQASGPYLWIEKRSFEEFTGSFNTTSAVSLVRKVPLHSGDSGFVVVNVNVDSLQKTIQEMSESSSYYVQLLDRNGKLIVEKTDPSEDSQDDRHTNHYKSKYTGWELRSGISNGPLFVLASAISYLWVFAALFMVIAAGAWIAYISRINYRPIESIIAKIRDYANPRELGSRGAVRDEFQYIETALTDLIEDIAYQKKQQEENLVYRKRHLFQEAITGTRQISNREWNALLKELELGDEAPDR
ncbi:MAG: hypothetical protein K0S39_5610, partial [Paenibacillus sp.]|nr:hypothetical protein [Paenibacillus sp.]